MVSVSPRVPDQSIPLPPPLFRGRIPHGEHILSGLVGIYTLIDWLKESDKVVTFTG